MDRKSLEKYAEVVIEVGVNLYEGQCLSITSGVGNYDFALILAETAYKKGAKFVEIKVASNKLTRTRIDNSDISNLSYYPTSVTMESFEQLANDWATIRIDSTEELNDLKGVDPSKLETLTRAVRLALKRRSELLMKHKHSWCVIAAPGPKWAESVLNIQPTEEATDKLWEKLKPILRLDKSDHIGEWKKHADTLIRRAKILDELKLDRILIKSEGTELEVGLAEHHKWIGGPSETSSGRVFMPNIPTEEIFSTPDYRRTNGKVKATRPVKVMETLIEGIWFEFKDGKVVKFGAKNNVEILEKFLNVDEGSSYLGEIALVDVDSPIFKSGLLFNSILYDENATSHIALGAGYPSCLTISDSLNSEKEKKDAGCNVSLVHTDFMIGSTDSDITGIDKKGKEIKIIKAGKFQI